jgi:hypothetical protein
MAELLQDARKGTWTLPLDPLRRDVVSGRMKMKEAEAMPIDLPENELMVHVLRFPPRTDRR